MIDINFMMLFANVRQKAKFWWDNGKKVVILHVAMVFLSFDTEEFDVPREHGVQYDTLVEGMEVSRYGTSRILDILKEEGVRGTFFCTTNFAENAPDIMQRIVSEGHEVAAHGCDHWSPKETDVAQSKQRLEELTGRIIHGYRQPRMFPVDIKRQSQLGYVYNASLNPAFIPGRYMHLTAPRTPFVEEGVVQIPASVTPVLRIPMFWLSLHNFPLWLYKKLCHRIIDHDGHFNTYFHPWEFYPLGSHPELRMPFIIRNNAGDAMCRRLRALIKDLKARGEKFGTYEEYARLVINANSFTYRS